MVKNLVQVGRRYRKHVFPGTTTPKTVRQDIVSAAYTALLPLLATGEPRLNDLRAAVRNPDGQQHREFWEEWLSWMFEPARPDVAKALGARGILRGPRFTESPRRLAKLKFHLHRRLPGMETYNLPNMENFDGFLTELYQNTFYELEPSELVFWCRADSLWTDADSIAKLLIESSRSNKWGTLTGCGADRQGASWSSPLSAHPGL